MAFRKRNLAVGRQAPESATLSGPITHLPKGMKPSSLSSHSITSTGCASLDSLFGGHGGLALGSSLLIEESGTTDFAGALLRFFAAEGVCQGHVLHMVGVGEGWVKELPAVAEERAIERKTASSEEDRMKIAWRYERLGQTGERALPDRSLSSQTPIATSESPFCHTFDLSKRLPIPQDARILYTQPIAGAKPFDGILKHLSQALKSSGPQDVHRAIIPSILSPALYPAQASNPENFLRFLYSLRALLRQYPNNLTAIMTLPLSLYTRSTGLVRWAELLCDGVIELTPFPHLMDTLSEPSTGAKNEEQPQGMLKFHKLPVNTERGEGGAGAGNSIGEDLAFTISRRKFVIKPYSLPPMEGDEEAQKEAGKVTSKDVEF